MADYDDDVGTASNTYDSWIELRRYRFITSASSPPERDGGTASNGYVYDYNPWDAMQYPPQDEVPQKYDPFGARQMWQPGYPRIRARGDRHPVLTPRFNQVQHTTRPLHGRRGRK